MLVQAIKKPAHREETPTYKDLSGLQSALCLEEEVGKGLGKCALLQ